MKIKWIAKKFNELLINELYDIYQLRTAIFVVEQNCAYQEVDEKDQKAIHIMGYNQKELIAVARILPKNVSYEEVSIGRFAVELKHRKKGVSNLLMEKCLNCVEQNYGKVPIRISAQKYVEKFYTKHGFLTTGKPYLEDNIPHIEMLKPNPI